MGSRSTGDGRPELVVVARAGDPRGALAVAVQTEGVATDRGAVPAVALAALVEARLGTRNVSAVGGWGGFRLRADVGSPAEASALTLAIREAMLTPVTEDDPALEAVKRKVLALSHRPLPDRALAGAAECTGEAFGLGGDTPPDAVELEAWRRAAHGVGRVAFATAGDDTLATAVTEALAGAAPWPAATPVIASVWPPADSPAVVYDASGEVPPGGARLLVMARTATPERAVAPADGLGAPRGPLASRLAALDAPARVRSVVATTHSDGGCVTATLEMAPRDVGPDAPARIATVAALARQEITVELADAAPTGSLGQDLAQRAAGARDAAERAAWWALSGTRTGHGEDVSVTLAIGIAATRDTNAPVAVPVAAIRSELDRATIAWHAPVAEARTRVERGQGEAWVLVATPCGTAGEAAGDAGSGAAVAVASVGTASEDGAAVEPFVAADGIGILAHGPARAGESPLAHARRLADVAARTFAAEGPGAQEVARARTALLGQASELDARLLGTAAGGLAPGHPSWLTPLGTSFGLASASDEQLTIRASTIRGGPLRVAVLANVDQAQADAAVRAVDRWIARRPGEVRECPDLPTVGPRPGTFSAPLPAGARSEALVAVPVPGDADARASARVIAGALDGPEGLLARSVPGIDLTSTVIGSTRAAALVVRVVATDAALDAAVGQVRALLARLHQGTLTEADRTRAGQSLARTAMAAAQDPGQRTVALWRGELQVPPTPSLATLNAFATSVLRDEALVIAAARPKRPGPAHVTRGR